MKSARVSRYARPNRLSSAAQPARGEVMGKLIVFNQISLDGYFVDANGDMSWAHNGAEDEGWDEFVAANASGGGLLVFGRITYELMESYWPTPAALRNDPVVAERMNNLPKLVFSRTLDTASWNRTRLVKDGMATEMRKLKSEPGNDMAIMGSGTIVSQLTQERLIDEYQIVVVPVVLGAGRTMFDDVKGKLGLALAETRGFRNGNVLLRYEPLE
jgi:dihydrofolate reductase